MKRIFMQKLSCIALCFLFLPLQLRAEGVKVDYTDYIVNPSFEYYVKDGVVDLDDPIDVTNTTDTRLYKNALRGTPPGWTDYYQDNSITYPEGISYGVNRGALNKNEFNAMWFSPAAAQLPEVFWIYQKVTGLPAGEYSVSCRLHVSSARLSNQRFFASTGSSNTMAQYFGVEADYRDGENTNIVAGETYSFAGWEMSSSTGDSEARLKPMSVVITVAEGDTLTIGIKTGRLKKDGTLHPSSSGNIGYFKADDFRIMRVVAPDPNDYTHMIANPSFELKDVDGVPTQITSHAIDRDTPYGWSDINRAGLEPTSGNLFYGVKTEASNADGAKSCWAQKNPFPDHFTLYQDITGLPAGKYRVSCLMFLEAGMVTNQRLFANNNVCYYGKASDYPNNLTDGEINTFAGLEPSTDNMSDGRFLRDMSVEVDIAENETLTIGVRTTNVKGDGTTGATKAGWFTVDNFRLLLLEGGDPSTALDQPAKEHFVVKTQEGGFLLSLKEARPTRLRVVSLSGQTVYDQVLKLSETMIELPQGLYVVHVMTDSQEKTMKVLVK